MSDYTQSLGLEKITPGTQAGLWGGTTNNTYDLIDQAITGVVTHSFAGANGATWTPTDDNGAPNESRAAVFNLIGSAAGANTVVVPNKQKMYLVRNFTGKDVTFQTASWTSRYTVEAGNSILIFSDGNYGVFTGIAAPSTGTLSVSGGGTGSTTFTAGFVKSTGGTNALTSVASVDLTADVGTSVLPAANGGTGRNTITSGSILTGNGSSPVGQLVGSANGQVPTWSTSTNTWVPATQASAGVTSFNGRTGVVVPDITDYSSFYGETTGTNTWTGINYFTNAGSGGEPVRVQGGAGYTLKLGAGSITSDTALSIYSTTGNINFSATNTSIAAFTSNAFYMNTANTYKPGGGSWLDSSDERLKENVSPLTGALNKLVQLNPVSFEWKYDRENISNVGFIAQEVATVMPLAVSESEPTDDQKPFIPEGQMVMNVGWQNDIFAYLVGAIKELKAEIDQLKAAK